MNCSIGNPWLGKKLRAIRGGRAALMVAELDHPARALGLEPMNMRHRMAAATNLAGRAEVIDMMMGRDDRIEIFDLDADFARTLLRAP